jgi:hypothetical protein
VSCWIRKICETCWLSWKDMTSHKVCHECQFRNLQFRTCK